IADQPVFPLTSGAGNMDANTNAKRIAMQSLSAAMTGEYRTIRIGTEETVDISPANEWYKRY
ncbi:hypothetical protein, partial [Gilvimarinus sp. 1_MG-2023]|uniref:hypothetical protein n=1 Tax=Gilvimarinus sp. 1_MG-2023 TaxID=3062638 RepID=UPI0026E31112